MTLTPPFPYFGSKRQAAAAVWEHLGDPYVYIEPFAGSLAVLLARPNPTPRWEIACDLDGLVINAWRAFKHAPDELIGLDAGPVSETEIRAWHAHLLSQRDALFDKLNTDYRYYDAELAYMWWAGASSWIGSGWCRGSKPARQRPHIDRTLKGVYAEGMTDDRILAIGQRLSNCILLAGDWEKAWERCVTDAIMKRYRKKAGGSIGVFLDPPYTKDTGRADLYTEDAPLSQRVSDWALEHADHHVRVVVAGYLDEYPALVDAGWTVEHWTRPSGYVYDAANERRHEDVLFLSPLS